MSSGEFALDYGDTVLRDEDVHLLDGPYWLNDTLIQFYFEYLTKTLGNDKVLLMPPCVLFMTRFCEDDEMKQMLSDLNTSSKDLILMAVNNNEDYTVAAGGSHWSLLIYDRRRNTYYHFDSSGSMNESTAKLYVSRLSKEISKGSTKFVRSPAPRVNNAYDCGVYVLEVAELITRSAQSKGIDMDSVPKMISLKKVSEKRGDIKKTILSLANK